jgi:hypothetical protein
MNAQSEDDDVGYRRPPRQHRWKPGQSGNPAGRPRRPKLAPPSDLTDGLAKALLKERRVLMDGREMMVPTHVAFAEALLRDYFSATPKEKMLILHTLDRIGALDRLRELVGQQQTEASGIYSEEDRRLLEIVRGSIDFGERAEREL